MELSVEEIVAQLSERGLQEWSLAQHKAVIFKQEQRIASLEAALEPEKE